MQLTEEEKLDLEKYHRIIRPVTDGKGRRWILVPKSHLIVPTARDAIIASGSDLGKYVALPCDKETVRMLAWAGVRVYLGLFDKAYHWPGLPPWADGPMHHQVITTEYVVLNKRVNILSDMALGKTLTALWAIDLLVKSGQVRRALIVATATTLRNVWYNAIMDVWPGTQVAVIQGSKDKKKRLCKSPAWLHVINHDGVKAMQGDLDVGRYDIVIVDEVTFFKNWKSQRTQAMAPFAYAAKRLVQMSGSLLSNSPEHAWAPANMIRRGKIMPFNAYRSQTMRSFTFEVNDARCPGGKRTVKKYVAAQGSKEKAFALLQPAIRFEKKRCLDLVQAPPREFEVALSSEQKRAIAAIKDELSTSLRTYDDKEVRLERVNGAAEKIRQVCVGVLHVEERWAVLPHSARLSAIRDLIEESESKTIIVCHYRKQVEHRLEQLKAYGAVHLYGGMSGSAKADSLQAFDHDDDCHVLIANTAVAGHGLNLQVASTMIIDGPELNGDYYSQVLERMARPGQRFETQVIKLVSHAEERRGYAVAEGKLDTQEAIFALFRELDIDQ